MRIGILHLFDAKEFMGNSLLKIAIIERNYNQNHDYRLFIMDKNFLGMGEMMDGPWLKTIEEAIETYLNLWAREQIIDEMDTAMIFEQI